MQMHNAHIISKTNCDENIVKIIMFASMYTKNNNLVTVHDVINQEDS